MPKYTFYGGSCDYLLVTGEYPRGFKGVLCVVWRGTCGNLVEEVLSPNIIRQMPKVSADDVPDEWYNAFALATGLFDVRGPEPEPEPEPEP